MNLQQTKAHLAALGIGLQPILYQPVMSKAVIDGIKTKTRRIIKPQPPADFSNFGNAIAFVTDKTLNYSVYCPYGRPGDILWVRENYLKSPNLTIKMLKDGADTWPKYDYVASCSEIEIEQYKDWGWKIKPSIHMPFEACRTFLRVKSIRVERLRDITDADAVAEGIEYVMRQIGSKDMSIKFEEGYKNYLNPTEVFITPKASFNSLFQSINGMDILSKNPWLWVVEFEKVDIREILNA